MSVMLFGSLIDIDVTSLSSPLVSPELDLLLLCNVSRFDVSADVKTSLRSSLLFGVSKPALELFFGDD